MMRPSYEELRDIARGAVEAVELANPGFAVIVIVQEPTEPLGGAVPADLYRTVAQSNVADGVGAAVCREIGALWERSRTL